MHETRISPTWGSWKQKTVMQDHQEFCSGLQRLRWSTWTHFSYGTQSCSLPRPSLRKWFFSTRGTTSLLTAPSQLMARCRAPRVATALRDACGQQPITSDLHENHIEVGGKMICFRY